MSQIIISCIATIIVLCPILREDNSIDEAPSSNRNMVLRDNDLLVIKDMSHILVFSFHSSSSLELEDEEDQRIVSEEGFPTSNMDEICNIDTWIH